MEVQGAEIATPNKKQNNDDASVIQRRKYRITLSSGKAFQKDQELHYLQ